MIMQFGESTMLLTSTRELILVLLPEAVTNGEEVPASLCVHVPDVCFLPSVLRVRLADEVHQEEHVVGQVVLLLDMGVKSVRDLVKVVLSCVARQGR